MGHTPPIETESPETRWRVALECAGLGVWDADLVSNRCYYSPVWKRMLGYDDADIGEDGDVWLRLVHPEDRERAIESGKAHEAGLVAYIETEFRLRHKDGHWVWVLDRGKVISRDVNGRPLRMVGVQTDITRQKQTEQELAVLNERHRMAVDASGIGLWHWDIDAKILHWDQRMHQLYGTDPKSFRASPHDWRERLHPDDAATASDTLAITIERGVPYDATYRIIRTDGAIRFMRSMARIVSKPGLSSLLVGTCSDVTDLMLAAQRLAEEKERLRITLQSIGDAVISTDTENRVTFVNRAAEHLLQERSSALLGTRLEDTLQLVHEDEEISLPSSTRMAMLERRTVEQGNHALLQRKDGTRRSIRDLASPVVAASGEILGSVLVVQDTTTARALQRDLAHAANHDMLTGLKSRSAFELALTNAIDSAKAGGKGHALLYIDLDRFKVINDTAGHAAGDSVLKNVANTLKSAVRARDIVARLGGDEFAILLIECSVEGAERVASQIVAQIGAKRFPWSGKVYEIGASIGISIIDKESQSPESVLAHADVACYAAKAAGRNRLSVFRPDAGEARLHMAEFKVASGIREAIGQDCFRLYAQEIRDLRSPLKRGKNLEILTRMVAGDGSVIAPGAFIPAAERFDLMGVIDRWVIRTALSGFAPGIMAVPDLSIAINLSANSLSDPDLWSFVEDQLKRGGLHPSRLRFEITETALINNFVAAERFVQASREAGCRISLDDFGSGVSSFTYLKRFKVDAIKIDGAFVKTMHESKYDRMIVRTIAEIASDIGVEVIAEFVERTETVTMLQSLGVGYGQGYLFHRPWPLADVLTEYGMIAPAPARVPWTAMASKRPLTQHPA